MRIKAQVAMVMNLDKCIGCHTCSVTCKNVWTNRDGAEYMWFNNVETKPGVGYPKRWEAQDEQHGGWELDTKGRLRLRAGGRLKKLATIFHNPDLPSIDDYYEPWTYDYGTLQTAKRQKEQPVARSVSKLDGRPIDLQWGPNWEDDLAGGPTQTPKDPNIEAMEQEVKASYEEVFMMYLPRICEHCLNPACVASCPSGAMYKREEDGIVLVDQEACRGWRMCMSGCPYKKVYFNHSTGKAEKCTLCYPRIEAGLPTVCSETCVGRIRYIGLVLYDADRVEAAASVEDPEKLLDAQLDVFLDPTDPAIKAEARRQGMPEDWLVAAERSPVWALAMKHQVALPLHPEYRTLPMVWYVPPLSPVMGTVEGQGAQADPDDVFGAIDDLRIPIQYLAELLSAGDEGVIRRVLKRLAAMRSYMREHTIDGVGDDRDMEELYRLLAIAKYEDRFVIPPAHRELAEELDRSQGSCGLDFPGGPGACAPEAATVEPEAASASLSGGALAMTQIAGNGRLRALREKRALERQERRERLQAEGRLRTEPGA
ncbi:nitrate reductase subunit beta [Patulibacter sp. SYSU D01012]|uniref:nitrate reductase subunit beta n=1 Tax=Patulibacter sp. SYSU D01012 TaxID=2817381 RepID=UPI001B30E590|nr:nitrate reductase subunit beta [Patulibacter sp. SYSU D01012]